MLALVLLELGAAGEPVIIVVSPVDDEIWVGQKEIKIALADIPPDTIRAVEVFLDGKLLKEFKAPPYVVKYNFGVVPRNFVLRVVVRGMDRVIVAKEVRSYLIDDFQEVDVTQVVVPVVVTDSRDNYVSGLEKNDFEILEEGVVQPITYFNLSGKSDFHLVLLIDISSSMKDKIGEVKEAAKNFLQELLGKGDQAVIIFFNHDVFENSVFSSDVEELSNSLAIAFPFGATALYDAIDQCFKLLKGFPGQNIVVVFSDGEDNSSYIDPYTLIKKAERSNATVYSIGNEADAPGEQYQQILKQLAGSSGGMTFFISNPEHIRKVYEQIRKDIRAKYVLQFAPPRKGVMKRFRPLAVRIKRKGKYNVRTIRGYYY